MTTPNPSPRPPGEIDQLAAAWQRPRGWRMAKEINNIYVGQAYIGAAFLFFLLAGVLGLLIRAQLAVPENTLLDEDLFNQIFTTHGTMMMFLFAVPAVEAVGILLLPSMLGSRDLPFPRVTAFAFWTFFIGGLAFFASLLFRMAPDGGWFMYPPLTSIEFSPRINADFWLLGIAFVEISAIAGAIEILVAILRARGPGMTLDRVPLFAWAMLVFAVMVIFAFPALLVATAMLELERAFGWPFFIAAKGGDPLLWQHLFWFFGHPEVYIIFLPATGIVSMIVAAMAGVPIVGYRLIVLALVGTGFLSFGLWAHHMYATGIPMLSLGFFSAASMAVAIPSGIQVFAWIATMANGRLRLTVPALFVLGFLFIFTLGGLTGVMVAMVPFDLQVHDTYFVVAHFHYVLIGGMVFPFFAAFYYWMPYISRRAMSETLGRVVFGLLFIGVNVTFFPMHFTGLVGMPRRVYTYPAGIGWDALNLVSSLGAAMIALGVVVFLIDLARSYRPAPGRTVGNIWKSGSLEWLPLQPFGMRSIPLVRSREPLWDQPELAEDVAAGRCFLPNVPTGGRETLITSTLAAAPQYLLRLPQPSWLPLLAAVFTAATFLLLVFKQPLPAMICLAVVIAVVLRWMWDSDHGPWPRPVPIGGGIELPAYQAGSSAHGWWATVNLLLVIGTAFVCLVFSHLFLWTSNPGAWPPEGVAPPPLGRFAASAGLYALSSGAVLIASRLLRGPRDEGTPTTVLLALPFALTLALGAFLIDLAGQLGSGLRPQDHSYGATIYGIVAMQGASLFALAIMALFTLARAIAGRLDSARRATFDNVSLFWHYVAGQGIAGLALIHLFPRAVG